MKSNPKIGGMIKQVAQLQSKMNAAQEELSNAIYQGESGGGMVHATIAGTGEVKKIDIHKEVLAEDPETVGDLVAAAINRALTVKENATKARLKEIGAGALPMGLKIPGLG